jgi:tripartite-type tricarboxylate transporter receptor subunit TctC
MGRALGAVCTIVCLALAAGAAAAQNYPQRPLKLIVPFAAGGTTDALGRALAHTLGERLGQPVTVDNRGGGGGTIGAEAGARSAPDGYTLLLGSVESFGMTNADAKRLNYNPEKDLAPVAMVSRAPNVIAVHPSVKATTLRELVELARAKPGTLRYGSPGVGTNAHIIMEVFKQRNNIELVHVPYKGGGAGINDLLSGQIEMSIIGIVTTAGHVRAGKLRALATTGATRPAVMAEVPTMAEAGFNDFVLGALFGVFVPSGTAPEILTRLTTEVLAAKQNADFRKRIADIGQELTEDLADAAFGRYMVAEARRWREMAVAAGIKD